MNDLIKMRISVLLLCVLLTVRTQAAPKMPADPVEWPNQNPYQTVGNSHEGILRKLPAAVVAAVQRQIHNAPSRWIICELHDLRDQHRPPLLQIMGAKNGYAVLRLDAGHWVDLSTPASVPSLNQELERLSPSDLQDRHKLERYCYHIVLLQKYGLFKILTPELQRQRFSRAKKIDTMRLSAAERQQMLAGDPSLQEPEIDSWLPVSNEQNRQKLLALFHDLAVTKTGDRATVEGNIITPRGAVEQWTFHLRADSQVELEGFDVREIYPPGTFFFPLVL